MKKLCNYRHFSKKGPLSIFLFFLIFSLEITAQNLVSASDTAKYVKNPKPALKATRITKAPKIDGLPTDECWKDLPVATDFVMHQPQPYRKSPFKTEFKIAYDDVAIYVLGYMYDTEPQKIRRELGARDELGVAADLINVGFDTYDDDQNAFRFGVTAAGVQFDSRVSNGGNSDFSWDAVWQSSVSLQKDGWVAEYRIPLSALRFANKPLQTWGLQIARGINRTAEEGSWAGFDPKIDGLVIQYGALTDLENIKPPLRLQFSPYLASGVQRSPSYDDKGTFLKYGNQTQISGGLDVKYGLNQSFTLDMTLIPNFGQVQSDNKVLNLSPFEVQFNENRPFFTEGSEIFGKGDIFYSRRIGGQPEGYYDVSTNKNEVIKSNPSETQLYNATKISGRTKGNLGVGFLNAVSAPMFAEIKNTETGEIRRQQTGLMTNYNVFVLNQALKNNSELSFTNASTVRDGAGRDANVSSLFTRLRDKKSKYELRAGGRLSQIFEQDQAVNRGFTTNWAVSKISGNWTWGVNQDIQDNKWDPNDLGIFYGNNFISHNANVSYQQVEANKVFLVSNTWANINHNLQYSTQKFMDMNLNGGFWGKFKNQWWANTWWYGEPVATYDFFEPRRAGKQFKRPPMYILGSNFGSDQRKKLYSYAHISYGSRPETGYSRLRLIAEPRYRVNNRLSFSHFIQYTAEKKDIGYAYANNRIDNDNIFGNRDRTTVENMFSAKYTFNPKSNLTFRARHYWSKVVYNKFYKLNDEGTVSDKDWKVNQDQNFNIFNIDMIYTWQFAPGSFVNLIWKNNVFNGEGGKESIRNQDYWSNVDKTFNTPTTNNLTLKVIYFLDYQDIEHKFKRK